MKKIILSSLLTLLSLVASADDNGTCGNNLRWTYVQATGTLTIEGSGTMTDFKENQSPWYSYRDFIIKIILNDGLTSIGNCAFSGFISLNSVNIPNSVTSIGRRAFESCISLNSVTIPSSVNSIGSSAFQNCGSLTSVTIPSNVTSIKDYTFEYCGRLTSVTIPSSVTSIGNQAFFECTSLASVHITDLETWCKIDRSSNSFNHGFHLFLNGKEIKDLVIPGNISSVGNVVFSCCSGLTSVTIPNSVTSIGYSAFSGCSSLTSVTIPNSVTSLGEYAFSGCSSLTSVTIPNSVTSLGNCAFKSCSNLTSVTILCNPIQSNGYYARSVFQNCSGIKEVTFDCETISSLFLGSTIEKVNMTEKVTSIDNGAFSGCTSLTSVNIPNSVTSIGHSAFYGCSGLTSIAIPNSVTSIGDSAFDGCICLNSVTIPSNVTSIGRNALGNIKKIIWLTNTPPSGYVNAVNNAVNYVANNQYSFSFHDKTIVYPFLSSIFEVDGIKYVPISPSERTCEAIDCVYDYAAANTKISSKVTYKGVTMSVQKIQPFVCYGNRFIETLTFDYDGEIAPNSFYGCINMKQVNWGEKITAIGSSAFENCSSLHSLIIPNKVTELGDNSFSNCTSLTYVAIGNQVQSIGSYSFNNCTSLTNVVIGNQVQSIGSYSFNNCTSLTNVIIGNQVNSIDDYSFKECKALTKISIPRSVTSIKNNVFSGCSGLKEVIIEDRDDELALGYNGQYAPLFSDCPLDYVYIGGNISYNTTKIYGYSPFYRNATLSKVVITDKETEITENEFYGCANLQYLKVGDGVEKFGDWAFSGCSSLKSLSFGTQLKIIGKEAFSDCTSVTEITSKAAQPPFCDIQALDDINKWNCKLYVPKSSMASYQAADQWKDFFFIAEGEGSGTSDNPDNKKCAKPTISYSKGELSFASETEGVEFVSTITDSDIASYTKSTIKLGVTYNISVYATKSGYENSEIVTATLCWIDVDPKTEGITNVVANVRANPVLIQSSGNVVSISGAPEGEEISIYNLSGQKVGSARAISESTDVFTSLQTGDVGIVKIGSKAVKVAIK